MAVRYLKFAEKCSMLLMSDDPDKQAEFQRLFGNKIPSPEEFICVVGKNLKF